MAQPGRGLLLLVFVLTACSRFNVRSDWDRSADFRALHTYAWLPREDAAPADQRAQDRFIDRRIRSAVDTELRAKGYAPADSGEPDFLLNYRLASEPASVVRADPRAYFGGGGWFGWPNAGSFYTESYDEGTLYIAVIDPRSKRMLWVGAAQARLLPLTSLEQKEKRVDAAVHAILARFPPR